MDATNWPTKKFDLSSNDESQPLLIALICEEIVLNEYNLHSQRCYTFDSLMRAEAVC